MLVLLLLFLFFDDFVHNLIRTSNSDNGNHSVSLPIILIKNEISLYFKILYLISYYNECAALFLGILMILDFKILSM